MSRRIAPVLLVLAASLPLLADGTFVVRFSVRVPASTPSGAQIYVAGNLDEMGDWRPDGVLLQQSNGGAYVGQVSLPVGSTLLYKVTRGTWGTVEKGPNGEEIDNRQHRVTRSSTVQVSVATWADDGQGSGGGGSAITGDLRIHDSFHSNILGNDRSLRVWLPPGYDPNAAQGYPVLYMHDGQNLFDPSTSFAGVEWGADETADRLIRSGRIAPIIIVGIDNTADRINEYTPTVDSDVGQGGLAADYARFVVEEVKPFIDQTYHTDPRREATGVAGSSLGGLVSLYLCEQYTEVFSKCGAVSPSLWWDNQWALAEFRSNEGWMPRVRFWLDIGTAEGDSNPQQPVNDARSLVGIFRDAGLRSGQGYRYLEVQGAHHNEAAWAARFDRLLLFLYGR